MPISTVQQDGPKPCPQVGAYKASHCCQLAKPCHILQQQQPKHCARGRSAGGPTTTGTVAVHAHNWLCGSWDWDTADMDAFEETGLKVPTILLKVPTIPRSRASLMSRAVSWSLSFATAAAVCTGCLARALRRFFGPMPSTHHGITQITTSTRRSIRCTRSSVAVDRLCAVSSGCDTP